MKKCKWLLLFVLFAIVTTGCVKFNATMDIKKDKSMKFSVIYAFDKSLMGENSVLKDDDLDELKKQDFTVEKYSEGNYEGYKFTKKINNIDEVSTTEDVVYNLSGMLETEDDNKYIFKVVKGEDKNTYTAKIKFDANDSGIDTDVDSNAGMDSKTIVDTDDEINNPDEEITITSDNEDTIDLTSDSGDDIDLSKLMSNLDLKFEVNLPYGAISSNATNKENNDKKLSWKLGASGQELMEFTFELNNHESGNIFLYIGIGVAVLAIIAGGYVILNKKKNNHPDK